MSEQYTVLFSALQQASHPPYSRLSVLHNISSCQTTDNKSELPSKGPEFHPLQVLNSYLLKPIQGWGLSHKMHVLLPQESDGLSGPAQGILMASLPSSESHLDLWLVVRGMRVFLPLLLLCLLYHYKNNKDGAFVFNELQCP